MFTSLYSTFEGTPPTVHGLRKRRRGNSGFSEDEEDSKVPKEFFCPVSGQIMFDPVVLYDGNFYERHCIEKWLVNNTTSPVTKVRLQNKTLVSALPFKSLITKYLEDHPEYQHMLFDPIEDYLQSTDEFLQYINTGATQERKMKKYLGENPEQLKILNKWFKEIIITAGKAGELKEDKRETLVTLLEYGASPNQKISKDRPLLFIVIELKELDFAKQLIEEWDCDIEAKSVSGATVLHCAAKHSRSLAFVKYLVEEKDMDINELDDNDDAPLALAAVEKNAYEVFQYLVKLPNAVYDYTNIKGFTPLHQAIKNCCWKQVEVLLDRKARANLREQRSNHDACTLLLSKMKSNKTDRPEMLNLLTKMIKNGYVVKQEEDAANTIPTPKEIVKQITPAKFRMEVYDALLSS